MLCRIVGPEWKQRQRGDRFALHQTLPLEPWGGVARFWNPLTSLNALTYLWRASCAWLKHLERVEVTLDLFLSSFRWCSEPTWRPSLLCCQAKLLVNIYFKYIIIRLYNWVSSPKNENCYLQLTIWLLFTYAYINDLLWSHFILSGLNYYILTSKIKCNILIVFILYWKKTFSAIEVGYG